ncbi:IS607 family transposase [Anatilimnocola sp. NA78]|uniref:IS607 family transposase n=1 Tax=Anatilimnocola sp. NA78 TaxID=3415683 RepID=UPI003CE59BE4
MSSYSSSAVSPHATSSEWLTLAEASREYRLHKNTLRKWDKLGKLRAYRVAANTLSHRRYLRSDLDAFMGRSAEMAREVGGVPEPSVTGPSKVILCARCSTSKQAEDLSRQVKRLEDYAAQNYPGSPVHRYIRTASGLNYQNKTFVRMIQDVVNNKFNGAVLLITHKDRLIRFGFDMVKVICEAHKVTIIQTEAEEDKSYITELTEDILAITHIASCRLYGLEELRRVGHRTLGHCRKRS